MQRACALVASAIFALPLIATWRQPDIPWSIVALSALIAGATLARPASGLLLVAGLLPMAAPLALLAGRGTLAEEMALSFLVAATLRLSVERPGSPSQLFRPVLLLAVLLGASALLEMSALQQRSAEMGPFLLDVWRQLTRGYFIDPAFGPLHSLLPWLEALVLAVVAERILRRAPDAGSSVARMFVFAGAALSAFSAVRLAEISLRQEAPFSAALDFVQRLRFNAFYPDINGAGSLYALFAVPAIWFAWHISRAWLAPALLLVLAVWLTGSRAAFVGVVGGLGVLWFIDARPRWRTVLVVASLAIAGLVLVAVTARRNAAVDTAVTIRLELARAAFRLTAGSPVFGIGLDHFKPASTGVLSPAVVAAQGLLRNGENAHNNFLQILAELGFTGLIAFLWALGPPFRNVLKEVAHHAPHRVALGLAGGLAAFLTSALLGHPLLHDHIRVLFFLAVGITTGLTAQPPAASPARRWRSKAYAVAVVAVIACVPFRVSDERRSAGLAGTVLGASEIHDALDGLTYRVAERRSTWFLSHEARGVQLPLRLDAQSATSCPVEITVDGERGDVASPTTAAWTTLMLQLPPPSGSKAWRRIDIRVVSNGCVVLVGPLTERP